MGAPILVLGSGDVASAVAHRLFVHGADVVLADTEAPAHPRRGIAFTDAWFQGTATLEGVVALMLADIRDLGAQLLAMDTIACTTASPIEAAVAVRAGALIDARMRKRDVPDDLRRLAPQAIGLGPGFTPRRNCTAAIETAWGDHLGSVLRDRTSLPLNGEPRALGGVGRERFVYASQGGCWRTHAHLGGRVDAGAQIGTLIGPSGVSTVRAPIGGALRGLSHDGVPVRAGQKLIEVDPRADPDIHGLGARPAAIARGVAAALGLPSRLDQAFFGFEAEFAQTLDCMPMSLRLKLDRCRLKLSLGQWRALPRVVRETLLEAPADTPHRIERMTQLLRRRGLQLAWPELPRIAAEASADSASAVPQAVHLRCAADGRTPPTLERWAALTPLQRYALVKLAGKRHGPSWNLARAEFAVDNS